MKDEEFLGDTHMLIRNEENNNPLAAYNLIKVNLLEKI